MEASKTDLCSNFLLINKTVYKIVNLNTCIYINYFLCSLADNESMSSMTDSDDDSDDVSFGNLGNTSYGF